MTILLNAKTYSLLDYRFVAAFSPECSLINKETLGQLLTKMLPIDTLILNNSPADFNVAVAQLLNNAVNHFLVINELSNAQIYLDYLRKHLDEFPLFDFHCFANTYQQIIDYNEHSSILQPLAITKYIEALEVLDLPDLADALSQDLTNFFSHNIINPLTQNNYLMD